MVERCALTSLHFEEFAYDPFSGFQVRVVERCALTSLHFEDFY